MRYRGTRLGAGHAHAGGQDAQGAGTSDDAEQTLISERSLAGLEADLERRRRGPLRSLALYASGADRKLLKYVPGEETNFIVLGTFVCLTALMSGAGTFVAVGFWIYGKPETRTLPVLAALVAVAFIFCFDRAVVRAPLNAYRFPREALESLWNPSADTRAFAAVSDAMSRPRIAGRIRDLLSMSVAAALRIVVSLCISFLVAEALLFVLFSNEVNREVSNILAQNAQSDRAAASRAYQTASGQINTQLDTLIASRNPQVATLSGQLSTQKTAYANAQKDVTSLTALEGDEVYGKYACATLTTSANLCTSGSAGKGPEYAQIQSALSTAQTSETTAGQNVSALESQLADAQTAAQQTQNQNASSIASLQSSLTQLTTTYRRTLSQINGDQGDTAGILIRHQALSDLAENTDPESSTVVPPAPCRGAFPVAAVCTIKRALWPPTPMGAYIVAVRLVLMIIDLMPIYLKMHLSLRRRRPYDQLRAALEERYSAAILNHLDERLVEIGGKLENRATSRKIGRSAAGAEVILAAEGFRRSRGLPQRLTLRHHQSALSSFLDTVKRGWAERHGTDLTELLAPPDGLPPTTVDESELY